MAVLKLKSKGQEVTDLQTKLKKLGYDVTPDGDFGNQTLRAVLVFQADQHLLEDGIVGPVTMGLIDTLLSSAPILGIDVSKHNGTVNWNAVKADRRVSFSIIKATEGATYVDPTFASNFSEMRRVGLPYGAYHFFRFFTSDPLPQAENFTRTVGAANLGAGAFAPVIDVEYQDAQGTTNARIIADRAKCVTKLRTFTDKLAANFNRTPVIYTNRDFWDNILGGPTGFENCALWVADYGTRTTPLIPAAWQGKHMIWQNTDSGTIGGINGRVDMNIFNGSKKTLDKALNR